MASGEAPAKSKSLDTFVLGLATFRTDPNANETSEEDWAIHKACKSRGGMGPVWPGAIFL